MAAHNGVSLSWGGLDTALTHAAKKLGNTQALMDSVGEALVSGTLKRFDAEKDPEGQPWEPSGRAQEDGGKTLTNKGHLRDSIDKKATSDTVMVGSNLKYARIHQKGGTITPKKAKKLVFKGRGGKKVAVDQVTIPARPYLGISDEDMDDVKSTMTDFLAGVFKA
uniref:Virion morphogenesis protein n=1 Tax=Myoviridae sp. ct5nJ10 TaxID=2825034 RepID=A0A8S5NV68_9CAUD|nr:MAG TPA: virion morphogenesis protein [Myoviridae sp. ct5nJ10]